MKDWKPNAPDLSGAFNGKPVPPAHPAPAGRPEMERLERQRKSPAPELALSAPGAAALAASRAASDARESRINYIRERLSAQRDRARGAFERAR